MRIISGQLKGRRLAGFADRRVRPTTDREKEMIFNKLASHFPGSRVLDLFSGTGALGLESHSRGASSVICIEKNPKILKKNLELLKLTGEDVEVRAQDVFSFLKKYKGESFDLVFSDPPFTQNLALKTLLTLSHSQAIHKGTVIVSEASATEPISPLPKNFKLIDQKEFSDKVILFLECITCQ